VIASRDGSIPAADTVMDRPSAPLLAGVFPGVTLTREAGKSGTLLAIDRARAGLGFVLANAAARHDPGVVTQRDSR
jgi:hypothetical protein